MQCDCSIKQATSPTYMHTSNLVVVICAAVHEDDLPICCEYCACSAVDFVSPIIRESYIGNLQKEIIT